MHITWPTGKHVLSVDVFLRALQRDVAWDFFYGTVNFDSVFGTVNHYGTVDMFAGRFNDAYRKAELDHTENFETPLIRDTFKAMLDDWTNASFDPFASPAETDKPFGVKDGSNTEAITRRRVAAARMVSVPGDEQIRTDATHPVNRMFADVPQDQPEVYPEPGFENEVAAYNLYSYISRSDVTWNPQRRQRVQGQPLLPDERGVRPAGHPRQRPRRVVRAAQRRDRLGRPGPRHRRAARQGHDEGRRRRRHARRHPPPGLQPEAVDAAGVGERLARAAGDDPHRQGARVYPVDF